MRKFNDLSNAEKKLAIEKCYDETVHQVCFHDMKFNVSKNGIDIQERIDFNIDCAIADNCHFDLVAEYINEDSFLKEFLMEDAKKVAEQAWFPDPEEIVVDLFDTIPAPPPIHLTN